MLYGMRYQGFKVVRLFLLFFLLLGPAGAMGGSLFKCKGPDGGMIFSDSPCPENAEQLEHTRIEPEPVEPVELPEDGISGDVPGLPAPMPPEVSEAYQYAAQFTQALSSLSPVKMSVAQYYARNGAWPKSLGAMGFDEKTMRSKQIERVDIRRGGEIRARLDREIFGKKRKISLTPKPVMGGMQIEWRCEANIPAHLLSVQGFSMCTSKGFK